MFCSTILVWNISTLTKNWARYHQKRILVCMYSAGYWYACAVPEIGLHVQYRLLVCLCSTGNWSACTVPVIGLHIQYRLLVWMYSIGYWSACTVPVIGLHVQYRLFVFMYRTGYWSACTVPFILENYSNIKFHENPSSGSLVVSCGQANRRTDRHKEADCLFSQFCERAWKEPALCTFLHTKIFRFQPRIMPCLG